MRGFVNGKLIKKYFTGRAFSDKQCYVAKITILSNTILNKLSVCPHRINNCYSCYLKYTHNFLNSVL